MKLSEIQKGIKGVFKLPVKRYYLGKITHGCPYFSPWWFNSTIITIRKERPQYLRCKYFKLLGYDISYGWPFKIVKYGLGWKDKFDSPRYEWSPSFQIWLFKWQFCMWLVAPVENGDTYWEMVLWYLKYSKKDILKARDTWGWVNTKTKQSTWDNNCLTDEYKI